MLKICPDCSKSYSVRATSCVHCGAPNDDLIQQTTTVELEQESTNWGFIIILCIVAFLMFFYGKETRDFVLNLFDAGVVAEVDLQNCENNRVRNEIKTTFENSPYAQTHHLKIVTMNVQNHQLSTGAALSCLSTMTLNNNQQVTYLMNFKRQGDNYLVEGQPW